MMVMCNNVDDEDDGEGKGGTVFGCKRAMSGNVSRRVQSEHCVQGTIPISSLKT